MDKYQFLPSLTLDEYEALRESIRENGVIEPVITDEAGNVIDGHHRVKACAELGVEYPTRIIEGLTEERKQDMSLELNMHRRHLTPEQKRELTIALREQGWTQERIGKAVGVAQKTVSNWLSNFSNANQPSPTPKPDPELDRLRKELAARDEFERKLEANHRAELEAAKSAVKIDQNVIDKLVAEKTAAKVAELEQRKEALEKRNSEEYQRLQAAEAQARAKEKTLEVHLAEKVKEIEAAAKANQDIGELERQRTDLQTDLDMLRNRIEREQDNAKVRDKLRKAEAAIQFIPTITWAIKEKISESTDCCGLSVVEMEDAVRSLRAVMHSAHEAMVAMEAELERMKKRGGLRLVENN